MHGYVFSLFLMRILLESKAPPPKSFDKRLKDLEPKVRQLAVAQLHCHRNPFEQAALEKMLRDPHVYVRWRAVSGAMSCSPKEALRLLGRAIRDKHHLIRMTAIVGIARFRGKRAYRFLRRALNDRHPAVRTYAIVGLVKRGHRLALPMLRQVLRTTSEKRAQEPLYALTAIENMKAQRALRVMGVALRSRLPAIRERTVLAIGRLVWGRRRERIRGVRLLKKVKRTSASRLWYMSLSVRALLSDRAAVRRCEMLLRSGPAGEVEVLVASLLKIRLPGAALLIRWGTRHPALRVQLAARKALRHLQLRSWIPTSP